MKDSVYFNLFININKNILAYHFNLHILHLKLMHLLNWDTIKIKKYLIKWISLNPLKNHYKYCQSLTKLRNSIKKRKYLENDIIIFYNKIYIIHNILY